MESSHVADGSAVMRFFGREDADPRADLALDGRLPAGAQVPIRRVGRAERLAGITQAFCKLIQSAVAGGGVQPANVELGGLLHPLAHACSGGAGGKSSAHGTRAPLAGPSLEGSPQNDRWVGESAELPPSTASSREGGVIEPQRLALRCDAGVSATKWKPPCLRPGRPGQECHARVTRSARGLMGTWRPLRVGRGEGTPRSPRMQARPVGLRRVFAFFRSPVSYRLCVQPSCSRWCLALVG
mmetsp:Transcript_38825/g.109847  ORF Transcript_38825/g.109847 Transcript_38825/m.109847 type:complete len:241 (+) Transcript_38825:1443-2165(+)